MTESQQTRKLCKGLETLGVRSVAIVGSKMQLPGVTDRIFLAKGLPGGTAWVEFKVKGGVISPAQKRFGRDATKRGALAVIYWFGLNRFTDFDNNELCFAPSDSPKLWLHTLMELGLDATAQS